MPRIPSAEELGTRLATPAVASTDVPNIQLQELDSLTPAQGMVDSLRERQDRQELSTAKMQFEIGRIQEDAKYDQDNDLDTIEERHSAGVREQLGKAAANITNPELRSVFVEDSMVSAERSKIRMAGKVWERKADRDRGYMANAFAEIVKAGQDPDNMNVEDSILAMQMATDQAVERGIMTNTEAQETLRAAKHDMVVGRIKNMEPERQLLALDEPWADNLPPGVAIQLREAATAKAEDQAAHQEAMGMISMSEGDGLLALREKYLDDEEMYQKVRTRFLQVKQDEEVGIQVAQKDLYDTYYHDVFFGKTKISDIPELDAYGMSDAQLNNLRLAEENAVKRAAGEDVRKYSDQDVVDELDRMIANGQEVKARTYWSKNYARLNTSDFRYYDARLSPTKSKQVEFKPLFTTRQLMQQFEDEGHKLSADQKRIVLERVEALANDYLEESGGTKNAPRELMNTWMKQEYANVILTPEEDRNWFVQLFAGDEVVPLYELDAEQRADYDSVTETLMAATGNPDRAVAHKRFNAMSEEQRARLISIRRANPGWSAVDVMNAWERKQGADDPADQGALPAGVVTG